MKPNEFTTGKGTFVAPPCMQVIPDVLCGGFRSIALLAVALSLVLWADTQASGQDEGAKPAMSDSAGQSEPRTLFDEWRESRPDLEKEKTACVMCAGFGLAIVCGQSCDSTGLTIRKPDGSENRWCGRCDSGKWKK